MHHIVGVAIKPVTGVFMSPRSLYTRVLVLLSRLLLECLFYHNICTPDCWCCYHACYWSVYFTITSVHQGVGVAIKPVTGVFMLP